jgi:hypothetical protein
MFARAGRHHQHPSRQEIRVLIPSSIRTDPAPIRALRLHHRGGRTSGSAAGGGVLLMAAGLPVRWAVWFGPAVSGGVRAVSPVCACLLATPQERSVRPAAPVTRCWRGVLR